MMSQEWIVARIQFNASTFSLGMSYWKRAIDQQPTEERRRNSKDLIRSQVDRFCGGVETEFFRIGRLVRAFNSRVRGGKGDLSGVEVKYYSPQAGTQSSICVVRLKRRGNRHSRHKRYVVQDHDFPKVGARIHRLRSTRGWHTIDQASKSRDLL